MLLLVAAIAVAALADALRRDRAAAQVTNLRRAGLRGAIYYADARCRLAAVRLPTLSAAAAPALQSCDFAVSPAGSEASSWSIWGGTEPLVASCRGDSVQIAAAAGSALALIGGCAPAWGPHGELTFIRRGDVVSFPLHGRARVVLPRAWLERELRLDRLSVPISAAWAGSRGLAVVVRDGSPDDVVALFAGSRLVAASRPGGRLGRVTSRRDGRALIVEQGAWRNVVLLDARLRVRRTWEARAAAWSPDGTRLAVATRDRVMLLDAATGSPVARPLRFEAVALAWR